jgi:cytochrome c2
MEAIMTGKTMDRLQNKSCCLIKWVIFIFISLIIQSVDAQKSSPPESPWKGREVFHKKGCVQCHSIYGKGGEEGPDLGKNIFYGTYLDLAAMLWNHFPEMFETMQNTGYQFPNLNKGETVQLIAYLSYIRYMGEPGDYLKGRKLLETKGCVLCHKFGGKGGDIGPDISAKEEYLSPLILVESIWNHVPDMMEIFEEYKIERPKFNDNEIVDLASGIQSYMKTNKMPVSSHDLGDPVAGRILAGKKGCLRCHSIRGNGGNLGPDFNDVNLNYSVTQIAGKMWNHADKMWEIMKREGISFPVFEEGEMADIIAYLYGLKLEDAPGNVENGKRIVIDRGCLSCHTLQGKGANVSVDLASISDLNSPLAMICAMWNHSPAMQKRLLEKNLEWPEFTGVNMADLYAYLRHLSQINEIN